MENVEAKRVWVVFSYEGCDDYGDTYYREIDAAFSRREDAEHYTRTLQEGQDVHELILDVHVGCKLVRVFNSRVYLQSGLLREQRSGQVIDTLFEDKMTKVVFQETGQTRYRHVMASSIVSQDHANELARKAREEWLNRQAA